MNKIQRESWVVITVAMRSSPTAVLAALLNLKPISFWYEGKIFRLNEEYTI